MKKSCVLIITILGIFSFLFITSSVFSADEDLYREQSEVGKMFHKFGRGVTNIFTGWIEIPKNIARTWKKYDDPFTGFVVGSTKGFGWGIARTLSGFYEVFSFPFPVPKDYVPLMEPEFILPSIWGEPLPFMEGKVETEPLQ